MYLAGYNARARASEVFGISEQLKKGGLIGMDLIGKGKFTVQNMDVNGEQKKVLTLEIP